MTDENKQAQGNDGNAAENSGNDQGQKNQASENMIPQSRFNQVNEAKKTAEAELKSVADSLVEDVPEEFKALVPDLPPAQKIQWLRAATKKGIFNPAKPDAVDTKRPSDRPALGLDNMSPLAMMQAGYTKK